MPFDACQSEYRASRFPLARESAAVPSPCKTATVLRSKTETQPSGIRRKCDAGPRVALRLHLDRLRRQVRDRPLGRLLLPHPRLTADVRERNNAAPLSSHVLLY